MCSKDNKICAKTTIILVRITGNVLVFILASCILMDYSFFMAADTVSYYQC